jgi:glutamate synthase domain-containing protein 3
VFPSSRAGFTPEDNIIVGNVALYGATGGEAFIRGVAGERFGVRNSGAVAVVEGVGDHGCEYMTRGRVVVLGRTGRNFAAGMSGGVAHVLDEDGKFAAERCNREMVALESFVDAGVDPGEEALVRGLVERHALLTGSARAKNILENWNRYRGKFVKVMPLDYRRALAAAAATARTAPGAHA